MLLFAFTALYVAAFHAPSPRGLDVGIVGDARAAATLQRGLDAHAPGAFDVHRYATEAQGRAALMRTDVAGAPCPAAGDGRRRARARAGPRSAPTPCWPGIVVAFNARRR